MVALHVKDCVLNKSSEVSFRNYSLYIVLVFSTGNQSECFFLDCSRVTASPQINLRYFKRSSCILVCWHVIWCKSSQYVNNIWTLLYDSLHHL